MDAKRMDGDSAVVVVDLPAGVDWVVLDDRVAVATASIELPRAALLALRGATKKSDVA